MAEAGGGRGEADGTGAAMADRAAVEPEPGPPEYLADYSEAFAAAADVVLVVEEAALPAHSHVLRMHSTVLDEALDMLLGGSATKPLPEDGPPSLRLPWPATEGEARAYLTLIYSKAVESAERMKSQCNALLVARGAHCWIQLMSCKSAMRG